MLAAVELDDVVAQTYRLNHPEVRLYEEDIRKVSPEAIMEQCELHPGQVHRVKCLMAPCQPFSKQNRYRRTDSRASLVLETIRFTEVLTSTFLFIENVPGLGQSPDILDLLLGGLTKLGYKMSNPTVVDAVNYGVPNSKAFHFVGHRP